MKLKLLLFLTIASAIAAILLATFASKSARAQIDIITGALVTSSMFSDESSSAGMYMKVYVDVELGKRINNLEIRRIGASWSKHASIQEEFQQAVKRQKYICQLVAAVHNLDDNSLMFYYVRIE